MTIEEARQLTNDPLFYGCLMIKSGDADGQLAGARNTTGNVLRPALQIIKTAPGITCVSGAMLLLTHAPEYGKNGILVMGDVAVTPVRTLTNWHRLLFVRHRLPKPLPVLKIRKWLC